MYRFNSWEGLVKIFVKDIGSKGPNCKSAERVEPLEDCAARLLLEEVEQIDTSRKPGSCLRDGSIIWKGSLKISVKDPRSKWAK